MLLCLNNNKNFSPKCFSLVTNAGAFKNIHEADIRAFVCNKKEMDTGPDGADVCYKDGDESAAARGG